MLLIGHFSKNGRTVSHHAHRSDFAPENHVRTQSLLASPLILASVISSGVTLTSQQVAVWFGAQPVVTRHVRGNVSIYCVFLIGKTSTDNTQNSSAANTESARQGGVSLARRLTLLRLQARGSGGVAGEERSRKTRVPSRSDSSQRV